MTRVTLRSMHRATERGQAEGVGFGVAGVELLPLGAGPMGKRLATKTAVITTAATASAVRGLDLRRASLRPPMVGRVHQPLGARWAGEPQFPGPGPPPGRGNSCP